MKFRWQENYLFDNISGQIGATLQIGKSIITHWGVYMYMGLFA